MNELIKLPIWKHCLEQLRAEGLAFGKHWPAEFFEEHLKCQRDTKQFAFEMMALRSAIEEENGFYLKESDNGANYSIPSAEGHEDVAASLDHKMRRCAIRSIALRAATLQNPTANLSDSARRRMEANLERASLRLVLISRTKSIEKLIRKNKPKLLDKRKITGEEGEDGPAAAPVPA